MIGSLTRYYHRMSRSEQRLAVLTLIVLVGAIVFLTGQRALNNINALNETIASLQRDLVFCTEQTAQADSVYKAFQTIAAQHSSKWTQEEIHDRLGREIRRLSVRNVPPPGKEATPAAAGGILVDIRSMPGGTLEDSGEGYRSYTISFRTEPAQAADIAMFLERLQRSDQALRIDSLDMTRQPASNMVTASIKVTRTVIGDKMTQQVAAVPPPSTPPTQPAAPTQPATSKSSTPSVAAQPTSNLARNANFEQWDAQGKRFPAWTATGCTVSPGKASGNGSSCLHADAVQSNAVVYQELQLPTGKAFDLSADIMAKGRAELQIADGKTGVAYAGAIPITSDGVLYKYHVRFSTPADPAGVVPIRTPHIVLQEKGTVLEMANVVVREAED